MHYYNGVGATVNEATQIIYNINVVINQYDKTAKPARTLADEPEGGRPRPWRQKKHKTEPLALALHELAQNKKANRVYWCGTELGFVECPETGQKRLKTAQFCRERLCPMCAWRRSLKIFYELSQVIDIAEQREPDLKEIFLTLTVKSCDGAGLSALIDSISQGWARLTDNRRFRRAVKGWFRGLEVTYNPETDVFHPHFHAILLVDKSYFVDPRQYLHTRDWVHMWRVSCQLNYDPICDVRAVKSVAPRQHQALAEIAKYTVKEADYIFEDDEFLTARVVGVLTGALKGRRLFAYGGNLKPIAKELRVDKPGDGDLINVDADALIREDIAELLTIYKWDFTRRDYFSDRTEKLQR